MVKALALGLATLATSGYATRNVQVMAVTGVPCTIVVDDANGCITIPEFPQNWATLGIDPKKITKIVISNSITAWPKDALTAFENLQYIETIGPAQPLEPNAGIVLTREHFHRNHMVTLQEIQLPSIVREIDYVTFWHYSFKHVDLSSCINLIKIGNDAFRACADLRQIDLSGCGSLTTIGEYAFWVCSELTSVSLPNNNLEIKRAAFKDCQKLQIVESLGNNIGNNIISVQPDAFSGCPENTLFMIPIERKESYDMSSFTK